VIDHERRVECIKSMRERNHPSPVIFTKLWRGFLDHLPSRALARRCYKYPQPIVSAKCRVHEQAGKCISPDLGDTTSEQAAQGFVRLSTEFASSYQITRPDGSAFAVQLGEEVAYPGSRVSPAINATTPSMPRPESTSRSALRRSRSKR
jgi:hypothetical protein